MKSRNIPENKRVYCYTRLFSLRFRCGRKIFEETEKALAPESLYDYYARVYII